MKNKVSFCITYYNQENFVKDSINSILSMDLPFDYEILVGDDGSNDGTLDVIKQYAKKYPDIIKYFVIDRKETSKSINRASANRLNLVKNATGEYIMFLDGDDYYCDKTFVKEALEVFNDNPNVECCAFNYKYLYSDGSEKVFDQSMRHGLIKSTDYISGGMYTHSGACVFRNIIDKEKLAILSQINNFDDNAITVYMLQFGDVFYFDKPIYVYRQTDDSLWNSINSIEQDLVNAFDYKLICDSAPSLKNEILKRQYRAIKNIYKNKVKLRKQLSTKYDKYVSVAKNNGDVFIYNLLKWKDLPLLQKLKTVLVWRKLKKINKGRVC